MKIYNVLSKYFWSSKLFILFVLITASNLLSAEKFILSDIKIFGNVNFDSEMIMANSGLKIGFEADTEELKDVIKRLDSLDLFADIEIVREGSVILIYVKENKLIDKVVIKGNIKIDSKNIKSEIDSITSYSIHKIKNIIEQITELYQKKGYLNVSIRHEVVESDFYPQKVNLIFYINEGKKATIKNISIIGNEVFSSRKLKSVIHSKEMNFYNFWTDRIIFNDEMMMLDQELLRIFYMNHGYYNFSIKNIYVDSNQNKSSFFITYEISEGNQYTIGDIQFDEKLLAIDGFVETCRIQNGNIFDQSQIDHNILHMIEFLNNNGFALADINAVYKLNEETQAVNVFFKFSESKRMNIGEINISGNYFTHDKIIRRRLDIQEMEQYSKKKVVLSKQNLERLGIFKEVNLSNQYNENSDDQSIDLNINVEEAETTSVNIGGGYDTSRGIIGNFNIQERNFRGLGQSLTFDVNKNVSDLDLMFDFYEPYINKKWSAGMGLFLYYRGKNNNYQNIMFNKSTRGYYASLGYQISHKLALILTNSFKINDISSVSKNASVIIKEQVGRNTVHAIGYKLKFTNVDNMNYPTGGYNLSWEQQLAIPWGDSRFLKNDLTGYFYKTLIPGLVWQTVAKVGYITGYDNQEVRIEDRYFMGSDQIRGFAFQGIGPRDLNTEEALGGRKSALLKLQLEKSLPFLKAIDLKASVFVDNAVLYGLENLTNKSALNIVANNATIRTSIGAGLSWMTPFGSMRVDYGIPIHYSDYDLKKGFRFIVGGEF